MMNSKLAAGLLVRWFFTLAVPFMLTLASVRLLLSFEFLRFEYQRPGFPADVYGFTTADRLENGMYAISYLFNGESNDFLAELKLPREKCLQAAGDATHCRLFNSTELGHLQDVKHIVTLGFSVAILCTIVAVVILLAAASRPLFHRQVGIGLRRGAHLTLAFVLLSAVLSVTSWDRAFDSFHEFFFAAGTWRFPFSDSLIRLYPERIFVDAALVIGGIFTLGALLLLMVLETWKRRRPGTSPA